MGTTRHGFSTFLTLAFVASAAVGLSPAARAADVPSLANAPIPAVCGQQATALDGYEKDNPRTGGHVALRVDQAVSGLASGDPGRAAGQAGPVTAVPLTCSIHGAAKPDLLLIYSPGARLLATLRLVTAIGTQAHATISELKAVNAWSSPGRSPAAFRFTVTTSNARGFLRTIYHSKLTWSQGHVHFRLGNPRNIDGAPEGTSQSTITGQPGPAMPIVRGAKSAGRLKPAPLGLGRYLARHGGGALMRFYHAFHGIALVFEPRSGKAVLVANSVLPDFTQSVDPGPSGWRQIGVYWSRTTDIPLCRDVKGDPYTAAHIAEVSLGLSCRPSADDSAVKVGRWPAGGQPVASPYTY